MTFVREALLVAGKDLRIERRSRVALQQILPFGGIVVVMFAFALDADRTSLPTAAPGLFWAAVLLAALLAIGRSFAVEESNGARDGLAALGPRRRLDLRGQGRRDRGRAVPARGGARRRRSSCSTASSVHGALVLVCAAVAATVGLAATGTVYGVLATGRAPATRSCRSSCCRPSRR